MTARRLSQRPPSGFTLLELMVALALFSLISIMSLQVLTGALHQRSAFERQTAETAALLRMMTLMRADLESLVPVAFTPPLGGQEPAFAPTEGRLALTLGGQARLAQGQQDGTAEDGFQRAIWQFDPATGRLTRRIWPVLYPRDPAQIGPETLVLEGIDSWQITPSEPSDTLPERITVTFESARHGRLRLVVVR